MDESSPTPRRLSKRKRAAFTIMPFLLLLLCLAGLNLWARSIVQSNPSPTSGAEPATAVPTEAPAMQSVATETTTSDTLNTGVPTLAATAAPPPTATAIPQPTLPATATITLLGPPDQSRVMAEDSLTVYWTWPLPLAEDQYFGVYLQEESGDTRVGRLEAANFGAGYRWQTQAQYLTDDGGEVSYLIKLETILSDTPLITSEPRTLFVLTSQ
ncbi:MAG: hypothetical protein IAF02_21795 [Anaerolineae bacterium]|nr:hypothetical protein [Anaerolineae bacterium]